MAQHIDAETILKQIGDPREVAQGLWDYRNAARVLSSQHPRMIERYPKQWIAVYKGKIAVSGRTLRSVLEQADKRKLPREALLVRFIDRTQRTMIL